MFKALIIGIALLAGATYAGGLTGVTSAGPSVTQSMAAPADMHWGPQG